MKTILSCLLIFSCVRLNAQIINTIAGNGTAGYSGDGGAATAAELSGTYSVAVDTAGYIFISEVNAVIRKVTPLGIISTIAGNDTNGYSGDGGPATNAKIHQAEFIAVDKKGNLFISDGTVARVRKVDRSGIISTYAGNGGITISGLGGPATAASIGGPRGICVDDTGNLYINATTYIYKVDTFGIIHVFAGTGYPGHTPDGGRVDTSKIEGGNQIAIDAQGNLYYTENTLWVRKISKSGIITTVAGNGNYDSTGNGGPATAASFNKTYGVYPDACGNVYMTDIYNNHVRVVKDNGIIKAFAGTGYGGIGSGTYSSIFGGYTGDGGPALSAELFCPALLCIDKTGNIYFSDGRNNVVRKISMNGCQNTTEIPEPHAATKGLSIYPNPSQGTFTLTLSSPDDEQVHVAVADMLGRTVIAFAIQTNKETEAAIKAPPGLYFVNAITATGRWSARMVVQ